MVREKYVIKDCDEALLVTKHIIPTNQETWYMNSEGAEKLINSSNGGIYDLDGGHFTCNSLSSEKDILRWYIQLIKEQRQEEANYFLDPFKQDAFNDLTEYIYRSFQNMTTDDIPEGVPIFYNSVLVSTDEHEIKSLKVIDMKFMGPNRYKVESYDLPITIYTLDDLKNLEETNLINTTEPSFPIFLNPKISRKDIRREKRKVLSLKQIKKNDDYNL